MNDQFELAKFSGWITLSAIHVLLSLRIVYLLEMYPLSNLSYFYSVLILNTFHMLFKKWRHMVQIALPYACKDKLTLLQTHTLLFYFLNDIIHVLMPFSQTHTLLIHELTQFKLYFPSCQTNFKYLIVLKIYFQLIITTYWTLNWKGK